MSSKNFDRIKSCDFASEKTKKPFNKIGLKYHDLISVNTKLQQFHDFLYECIRNVVHNIYKKD